MNVTLDGFMAGPQCELDWHFKSWNEEMARATAEQLGQADTIILGGITYRGMAQYWNANPVNMIRPREDLDFASMLNSYPKVVFSKSMSTVTWNNARLARRAINEEVNELKQRQGKDMIVYGSGKIVAALTKLGLVDEFRMWVHPVVIGCGKPVFKGVSGELDLELYKTETFGTGVVILYYTVK
jgi:dihydrofolate reductase